ncbi:peptide ABC transporter permease [Oceanobacillus chungangensis]|uniref:Peptide ABC transporter permease n=1 Tax=Oceanobacillus chungangensis TaxID=1229152 RepID=A0A3D8PGD7_9BACI|nr:peptide ABC transporter permease [Oceanobacillus chungangensis]RDW15144.1 peptide ABC transporter permease [Oceanobacillus chungangensis]
MGLKIEIYEIIIFMLVYGGLFIYILRSISSKNKTIAYIKSAFLIILYIFIGTIIWFTYKAEEYHINNHSGLEPISVTNEATLVVVGFSIYSIILLLFGIHLKRKRHSVNT